MIRTMLKAVTDIFDNVKSVICGFIMAVLGYFVPIKDIVHLLIFFFFLDVIFGYWAAHRLKGESFNVKIIWNHTAPRMLIVILLVMCAYMWDEVFDQAIVSTHKIIGWFFGGVLLLSIVVNAYKITKWEVLPKLGKLIGNKIEEKTGVSIEENSNSTNDKN